MTFIFYIWSGIDLDHLSRAAPASDETSVMAPILLVAPGRIIYQSLLTSRYTIRHLPLAATHVSQGTEALIPEGKPRAIPLLLGLI